MAKVLCYGGPLGCLPEGQHFIARDAKVRFHQAAAEMGQVVIRNIDDRVVERLKLKAAAERKSLEQCLREVLTRAAQPSRAELLAELERIRAAVPPRELGSVFPTAEQLIREDRDTR